MTKIKETVEEYIISKQATQFPGKYSLKACIAFQSSWSLLLLFSAN